MPSLQNVPLRIHDADLSTNQLLSVSRKSQIYSLIDNSTSNSTSKNTSASPDAASNTTASPYLSAHFMQRDDAFARLLCLFGLGLIILRYRVHQPR